MNTGARVVGWPPVSGRRSVPTFHGSFVRSSPRRCQAALAGTALHCSTFVQGHLAACSVSALLLLRVAVRVMLMRPELDCRRAHYRLGLLVGNITVDLPMVSAWY